MFRRISATALSETRSFCETRLSRQLIAERKLVTTTEIREAAIPHFPISAGFPLDGSQTFEHERVWFPSYAYEWPAEMLQSAGFLTLEIAERALEEDYGLKDATPYNVLFSGAKPIFVDLLSFERRDRGDYIWLAYAQFVRMFLLPLLLSKYAHLGFDQALLSRPHGIEPEEVYDQLGWFRRLRRPLLTEVSIPTWLKSKHASQSVHSPRSVTSNGEKARFILRSQFRRLRRALQSAAPHPTRNSHWSSYMGSLSYTDAEFKAKDGFVSQVVAEVQPKATLDVGCNTGHFSSLAATGGSKVVAIDIDPVVVGSTWRRANEEGLDILPLVINLARPTPATGWRNSEFGSFLDRAAGAFDLVLFLATLHHLLVTERIPLEEILRLASELSTEHVVIEFVDKNDPMFVQIARGRMHLHQELTRESFESACRKYFHVTRAVPVKGDLRWLYLLRKVGT